LIDNLKFDLRIYALLYGVNPLRIYLHERGLARFSTEEYQAPNNFNMDNLYMHLTNYAINKHNDNFQQNEDEDDDDEGHKRSFAAILRYFERMGHDTGKLKEEIKEIIVKTLIIGQPFLSHLYRSCQPDDLDSSMCFQVLGFDILIDRQCKPWLLEVNQSPSFSTDSPLDYLIKKHVLGDAFRLLNVSFEKKMEHLRILRAEAEKRIYQG
jgi:tubulin polyglutamylase TTLL6/13